MSDEWRLQTAEAKIKELEAEQADMAKELARHDLRLENGAKAFQNATQNREDLAARISHLEPKAPNYYKLVGLMLTIFLACGTALWALAERFRERPTFHEVENKIDDHTHESMATTINDIRIDVSSQKVKLERMAEEQADMARTLREMNDDRKRRRR